MMKKKKTIIWVMAVAIILAAIALAIFLPRNEGVRQTEGTMSIICPVKVYQNGEIFKCPCALRPKENCLYTDPNNCQYDIKNAGVDFITKGEPVIVVRQRIQGSVQYLEVNIPE